MSVLQSAWSILRRRKPAGSETTGQWQQRGVCGFQVFSVAGGRCAYETAEDTGEVGLVVETNRVTDIRNTGTRVL
jgi:hypothetical protein